MSDIVERLREASDRPAGMLVSADLMRQAAAEIERLRHIYQCQNEATEREIKRRWLLEEELKRLRSIAGKADVGPLYTEYADAMRNLGQAPRDDDTHP